MSERPTFRAATQWDCAELALNMREADQVELGLCGHSSAYAGLLASFQVTPDPVSIISPGGQVLAMFGVTPWVDGFMASPWMLGADELPHYRHSLMRRCASMVDAMQERYPILHNEVWAGNAVHINWLRRLGFEVSNLPGRRSNFLPFWRVNNVRSSINHRGHIRSGGGRIRGNEHPGPAPDGGRPIGGHQPSS